MIRTLACALTVFAVCSFGLHADEPQPTLSNEELIQQNEKARPQPADSPPLFRAYGRKQETEFDARLRDALTSTIGSEAHRSIQQQLNGSWKYVAAVRFDGIETYDDRDVRLVIHDELCGVFEEGKLSGREPDRIRILTDSDPIAYTQASDQVQKIRFGKRAGTFLSYGLLRVDDSHLMMTSTTALPMSGAYGSTPLPDFFEGIDKIDYFRQYLPYFFPDSFSPEGTRNRQVILRRVSDSTELLDRAADRKPDGEQDPLKLTRILQQAREQEQRLKQVHLRIEARVSSLQPRAELAPHTDETLRQAIRDWRDKHSRAEAGDPAAFRDLIEALSPASNPQDQISRDGIPLTVELQAGKSVTRIGTEIVGVTDGDVSVYIDRQQGTNPVSKRGSRIPYQRLADFRFSIEAMPDRVTKSYTAGIESNLVGESVVGVHLKQGQPTLWRPDIPWVMTTRRSRNSGTVSGAYSRSRRLVDSQRVRGATPPLPPPPPLPAPLPPSPPDLLTYRYNTETKLVEDYLDYAEYAPGDLFLYKAFSFGAVKVEQPAGESASPVWFPRYFLEVYYKSGIPREFIVRRIESVQLISDSELETAVPAEAGAMLFRIRSDDWPEEIRLEHNVDDVVAHIRQKMHANTEK